MEFENTEKELVNLVNHGDYNALFSALDPAAINTAKDWHGDSLLALACWSSHNDIAKKLVELGAEVNSVNETLSTPLHRASFKGNLELVDFLIDNGADYNMRDRVTILYFYIILNIILFLLLFLYIIDG